MDAPHERALGKGAEALLGARRPDPEVLRRASLAGCTVAVLTGGTSSEREIALASGAAVCAALSSARERGPSELVRVEIEADGRWSARGARGDPAHVVATLPEDTLFFPALHGGDGEGGGVQAFLETAGRRFVGSGSHASRTAMDKFLSRELFARAGIACAPGRLVLRPGSERDPEGAVHPAPHGALRELVPCIVKPRHGGSSVATSRVRAPEELDAALQLAFASDESAHGTGDDALVEELVEGVEASAGVLEVEGEPFGLTPVEIRPRGDRFFDYEQKYDASGALELCPPESLEPHVVLELERLALRAHRLLGCRGFSRTDFIVTPGGRIVTLELNTLPGLVERSLLPRSAATDGISFPDLVLHLLCEARRGR